MIDLKDNINVVGSMEPGAKLTFDNDFGRDQLERLFKRIKDQLNLADIRKKEEIKKYPYSNIGVRLVKSILKYLKHEDYIDFDEDLDDVPLDRFIIAKVKVLKRIETNLTDLHKKIFNEGIDEDFEIPTSL